MSKIMKIKVLLISVLLLLCACVYSESRTDYSELNDSETSAVLRKTVAHIASSSMRGRKPGTDEEKAVASYIYDKMKEAGVEMLCPKSGDTFGISLPSGDTLTSRNVLGFVQGSDPELSKRYIVVGARMDNIGTNPMTLNGKAVEQIYYGANGNASGLAMMLELARIVSVNSILFRRSIIFVAFGSSTMGFAGSWYFLNRSFKDVANIDAMINLDMLGCGEKFYAYTSSNKDLTQMIENISETLQPIKPEIITYEPFPSDHRAFYAKKIPSVYFTTGKYPEYNTPKDVPSILDYELMERELEYIYNFTREEANTDMAPEFHRSMKSEDIEKVCSYYDCDKKPSFMGHTDLSWFVNKWVYQYLRYSSSAVKAGIQGKVYVEFAIDRNGKVTDVNVTKSLTPSLDEEVIRVIKASPSWKPGIKNGKKVKCYISMPIYFVLKKK